MTFFIFVPNLILMKISDIVKNKVDKFRNGYVFTYSDFSLPVHQIDALKKVLSRMVKSGKIERLAKGKYYKPETGTVGMLKPDRYQVVKDLLERNGRTIGYLTGNSAFNKLGLTTQVSSTIEIGSNELKKPRKRGIYKIRFIIQKNTIYKDNIYLLQILDSFRFIKRIPGTTTEDSCKKLINILKALPDQEKERLLKLSIKYNPSTRAVVGAAMENIVGSGKTNPLFLSLNPASFYNIGISNKILKNKNKWRIR